MYFEVYRQHTALTDFFSFFFFPFFSHYFVSQFSFSHLFFFSFPFKMKLSSVIVAGHTDKCLGEADSDLLIECLHFVDRQRRGLLSKNALEVFLVQLHRPHFEAGRGPPPPFSEYTPPSQWSFWCRHRGTEFEAGINNNAFLFC